jgi:hypothetical protein
VGWQWIAPGRPLVDYAMETPSSLGLLNLVIQGGSFALIAFAIVYLLPRGATKLLEAHREAVTTFQEAMAGFRSSQDAVIKAFRDEVEAVRTRADQRAEKIAEGLARQTESLNGLREVLAKKLF